MPNKHKKTTKVALIKPELAVQLMASQENVRKRSKSRRARKGLKKSAGVRSPMTAERSFYRNHLLFPSLTGPFRQPRLGSPRTGLAFDVSTTTITGSGTNTVQGIQANTAYFSTSAAANQYAVANEGTALASFTAMAIGAQFPSNTQMADINLVSEDIVVYYTGSPLNAQGEVLLGSALSIATTSSYNALSYYPGTLRVPVAALIEKPMRVAGAKLSPVADEFTSVTSGTADYNAPFVFASGLPTGGTLKVTVTRCYEYRSTTSASAVIPFESASGSFSGDQAAFSDARSDIAQSAYTITAALPEAVAGPLASTLGLSSLIPYGALGSLIGAAGAAIGRHLMSSNQPIGRLPRMASIVSEDFV